MNQLVMVVFAVAVVGLGCISDDRHIDDAVGAADADAEVDTADTLDIAELETFDTLEPLDTRDAADDPDTFEPPDTRDTSDVADTVDATTTNELPDVLEPDVDDDGDVEVRIEDAFVPDGTCTKPDDCEGDLPPCSAWTCAAGFCEAVDVTGGPCDDDNVCTGAGVCQQGVCVAETTARCDNAVVCGRPACDPTAGCISQPVASGICDGAGTAWGTCDGARMAPIDVCSTSGVCLDQTTNANVPIDRDAVLGDWFMVSNGAYNEQVGPVAGIATFSADGTWGGTFKTSLAPFTLTTPATRSWCIDGNLGVALDFSINHQLGQVDAAGETMVLSGKLGNELVVAVRPKGFIVDADGTYAVMMTGANDAGQLRVWSGTMVFSLGCIAEGSAFIGELGEEPFFIADDKACFAASSEDGVGAAGLVTLDAQIETSAGATTKLQLRGAIGSLGDVMLFDRESGESVKPGMLVLVRLDDSAGSLFAGTSRWIYAAQERHGAGPGAYRGFPGGLFFQGTTLMNGTFGSTVVYGDNIAFDDYGRFVVSLRATEDVRTYSGYIAPTRGFGFFYQVDPPDDWLTVLEVTEQPSLPVSYGIMIRRP